MSRTLAPLAVLLIAVAVSCRKSDNEAAKKRIFSPEEPVGVAAEAKEPLDASRLDDPQLARRVLTMPRGEVAQRLQSYHAQTRVQFAWFRGPGMSDGGSEVSLAEETSIDQAKNGDFALRMTNDHNQGFEMAWVKGEVFVKGLFGPFRKRRTDRTEVGRVRDQSLAALQTFDRLARGLKLKPAGEASVEGRRVLRYTVDGFGARGATGSGSNLPPIEYPGEKGPDPDTARRLELWEKEEPVKVSGTVVIDAETAAPLGCDLRGRFRVPAQGPRAAAAAELELHAALVTKNIGKDTKVDVPQWEPEASVPHAVKDPLRFLGKEPAANAGAPAEKDTTDEEEAPDETGKPEAPAR